MMVAVCFGIFLVPCFFSGAGTILSGGISGTLDGTLRQLEVEPPLETDYSGAALLPKKPEGTLSPNQEKVNALLFQAGSLLYQRRFDQARETIKAAESLEPNSVKVLELKAAVLAESGQISGARAIYTRLGALDPEAFDPKFNLAELLFAEKKADEAREAFETLLKQFPHSDLLRFKILLTYLVQKNNAQALVWLEKLKQPKPSLFMIYGAAAVEISNGNISEGKALLGVAEKNFSPNRQALLRRSLADIGFTLGDH